MKKVIAFFIVLTFTLTPLAFAAEKVGKPEIVDAGNTICPIMGGEVNPKISVVYKGVRYHLCCRACEKEFKKHPEKYIAVVQAEKK